MAENNDYDDEHSDFSMIEQMKDIDRVLAESEALLRQTQDLVTRNTAPNPFDIEDILNSSNRILNETRLRSHHSPHHSHQSSASSSESGDSTQSLVNACDRVLTEVSRATAASISNLNDSEVVILDCSTFPLPRAEHFSESDDEVVFVGESVTTNLPAIDLSSPAVPPPVSRPSTRNRSPRNLLDTIMSFSAGRRRARNTSVSSSEVQEEPSSTTTRSNRTRENVSSIPVRKKKTKEEKKEMSTDTPIENNDEPTGKGTGLTCAVCLDELRSNNHPVSTNCGHLFCYNCLIASIKSTGKCPLCNKKQSKSSFHRIYF